MQAKTLKPMTLGSVSIGTKFVFRTAQIFGAAYDDTHKLPFEGKVLTVVRFKPRYVNQVVVQDPSGYECLLRLSDVEKCLNSLPLPDDLCNKESPIQLDNALEFVRQADGPTLTALIREIKEVRRGLDVNTASHLNVGDIVTFDCPEFDQALQGRITKINGGRVTIAAYFKRDGSQQCISVPASMVRRCSQEKEDSSIPTHVAQGPRASESRRRFLL